MRPALLASQRMVLVVLLVLVGAGFTRAETSSWLLPQDGVWDSSSNWSNGLPNNSGTTSYDAVIAAAGNTPYSVSAANATVDSFTLNSPRRRCR